MSCAKFGCGHRVQIWIRTNWNFYWILNCDAKIKRIELLSASADICCVYFQSKMSSCQTCGRSSNVCKKRYSACEDSWIQPTATWLTWTVIITAVTTAMTPGNPGGLTTVPRAARATGPTRQALMWIRTVACHWIWAAQLIIQQRQLVVAQQRRGPVVHLAMQPVGLSHHGLLGVGTRCQIVEGQRWCRICCRNYRNVLQACWARWNACNLPRCGSLHCVYQQPSVQLQQWHGQHPAAARRYKHPLSHRRSTHQRCPPPLHAIVPRPQPHPLPPVNLASWPAALRPQTPTVAMTLHHDLMVMLAAPALCPVTATVPEVTPTTAPLTVGSIPRPVALGHPTPPGTVTTPTPQSTAPHKVSMISPLHTPLHHASPHPYILYILMAIQKAASLLPQ